MLNLIELKTFCEEHLTQISLTGTPQYSCPWCTQYFPGGGSKGGAISISGGEFSCSSCGRRGSILDLMEKVAPFDELTLRERKDMENSESYDYIDDKKTREGLFLYRYVLQSTKSVFGEDAMTEAVVCKAIEAASYGMWRSIMGPKFDERKTRTVL